MKTSIALTGFMGTGKTAVGKVLAEKLGKEFIETDALIEKRAGKSIPRIFADDGEIRFRELEIETIAALEGKKDTVIACGGGAVLNAINVLRLRKECVIVCLTASPGVILKRTSTEKDSRPLLAVADREKQIKELLKYRQPFYERAADFKVNTSLLSVAAVTAKIIEILNKYEYHDSKKRG
jgi:shikimate kinase